VPTKSASRPPAQSPPISVAIIDDNRLVREALCSILGQVPGFTVVGSANADAAFLTASKPQVLLLDVGLRDEDSLRVATGIRHNAPDTRIIVMDLIPVNEEIVEFVNAGVSGFVLKDASFDEFVATIRRVAAGEKVLPPRMTDSLFSQIARDGVGNGNERTLDEVRMTRREQEVIGLIGEGLSNKEIASRLNIATHTVKSHVRNVMEKLALHTRLQIAAYSHRESNA
jgi:DNA-binding NarL/FixJ family response regulator